MKPHTSIGIIGAGIAGLACAKHLRAAGAEVCIFEKSRGVGGRIATRRTESGATFDHGAQYFTARDLVFDAQVKEWVAAGVAAKWQGRIVSLSRGIASELENQPERFVGVPTMNAIAKSLAAELNIRTSFTVQKIHRTENQWQIEDAAGERFGPFDLLISTAPPPQTVKLFGGSADQFGGPLEDVTMNACWAVMLQLREPLQTSYDAAFVNDSPLGWIARNSSKPGRPSAECWVLHATAAWSRVHLEEPAESIAGLLVDEFWRTANQAPQAYELASAHRWRFALPSEPLPQRYLFDPQLQLAACGDWCGGPRVEGAYLSGLALAKAIVAS